MKNTATNNSHRSDSRSFAGIYADLLRLQDSIKEKLLDGELEGLAELIDTKGDWEKALAESSESLSPEAVLENAALMEGYFKNDREIAEILAAKMKLANTAIQKASIARKIMSNFQKAGTESANEKSRPPSGSFFDASG